MPKSPPNDKALQTTSSANVPTLQRAKSLIKLTDSVLGRDRSLTARNAWLDELIAWADENGIHENAFPRNADEILELKSLRLTGFTWEKFDKLSHIPESIGNLTNLTELRLVLLFGLSMLPDSIGNLTNLLHLDLYGNNLSVLPDSIWGLTNLETLNLSDNKLSTLPASIGNLTNLKELRLDGWCGNNLSTLPDSIWSLTNLEYLLLHDNNLSVLSASIGNLTNLKELSLSGNKSLELPDALGKLENLECLCLSTDQVLPPSLAHLEPIIEWYEADLTPVTPSRHPKW